MLPTDLTKRLVNHAPSQDITGGCAADWTIAQSRDVAQRIAHRIDELIRGILPSNEVDGQTTRPACPIVATE